MSATVDPKRRRTALVTGGGTGIGRSIALALAMQTDMDVWIAGRRQAALDKVAKEADGIRTVAADITDPAGLALIQSALPPALDVLVHSAGVYSSIGLTAAGISDWLALLAANLQGPMQLTAACLDVLEAAEGLVVVVNSTAGLPGSAAPGLYAASKQALRAATDKLRVEVQSRGIRVLSIYPGRTDTPMQQLVLAAEGRPGADIPLMQPDDVAAMLVAVVSLSRSSEVTEITMRPSHPAPRRA